MRIDPETLMKSAKSKTPSAGARWEGASLSLTSSAVLKVPGGPPVKPPQLKLFDGFEPARGIYLVTSDTGQGKTATLMGITMWANARNIPATYMSIFEPRETLGASDHFKSGKLFFAALEKTCIPSPQLRLLCLDSVTGPLKDYSSNYPDQSTFAGGMQPSDRAFCVEGARRMHTSNMVGFWAVNKKLVPYIDDLAGSTEGLINVHGPGEFTFHDRTPESKRKESQRIKLPEGIMTAVFKQLS